MMTLDELCDFHAHIQHTCDLIAQKRQDQFLKLITSQTNEITIMIQPQVSGLSVDDAIDNVLRIKRLETILQTVDLYISTKYGVIRYAKPS